MKILYIAGAGRSGSTLLERIIGNLDGYFSVGEVRFFWEFWEEGNRLCGCGQPLRECEHWSAAWAGLGKTDVSQLSHLAATYDRTHNLPWMATNLRPSQSPPSDLVNATQRLYSQIAELSGEAVLVDSSKVPSHLYILRQMDNVDIRVLHLVRDGRAVAYSWNKRQKQELGKRQSMSAMPTQSTLKSLLVWMVENHYTATFGAGLPYTVMRYEDFTQAPLPTLKHALNALGLDISSLPQDSLESLSLTPTHSVNGNPNRFAQGTLAIRRDDQWLSETPVSLRALQGLISWPVLSRYDYPVFS